MHYVKVTIAVLSVLMAFTACKPTYTCHCKIDIDSNAHAGQAAFYEKDIKAKDRTQATLNCTRLDPNCSVK